MRETETGRSMVEILGVLAIMGVLSIGGIAGYTYAMDRQKANDILDGINKRAVALSPMMMVGQDIPDDALDSEFGTRIGDTPITLVADKTGFDLSVSGVSGSVCQHVLNNGLKMASAIFLGEDIVWDKGVKSEHTCAQTNNEITFAFNASLDGTQEADAASPGEECDGTCQGGATCVNGYCQCPEGAVWQPSSRTAGEGTCKTIDDGDCTQNSDCEDGEYCQITGTDCHTPNSGTCQAIGTTTKATYNGQRFLYSSKDMTWWAARHWCQAQGKSLISFATLSQITGTPVDANYTDSTNHKLYNAIGKPGNFFTSEIKNSCDVYVVDVNSSREGVYGRHHYRGYYAMCQ